MRPLERKEKMHLNALADLLIDRKSGENDDLLECGSSYEWRFEFS